MSRKLVIFTLATYLFSWSCWLPIIDSLGENPFEGTLASVLLFFLGAYGPTLIGIAMVYFYGGRTGLRDLFKRALAIKSRLSWMLLAVLVGPLIYAFSTGLYVLLGGEIGAINYGLIPWLPIVFVVPIVFGPLAEEFGWRGFALPLFDHKNKAIASSIIIGIIWALWHAPLFWAETGTAISGFQVDIYLVSLFFLAVIGSSFIYTWLFNRTSGSLAGAILLHLGMNASGTITGMLFPEMSDDQRLGAYEIYVSVLWIVVAGGAVVVNLKARLSKQSGHSPISA